MKRRFQELDVLGAFHVLRPQSAARPDNMSIAELQTLAKQFCPDQEKVLLQEWFSFKNHLITGSLQVSENLSLSLSLSFSRSFCYVLYLSFKNKSQEELLTLLASEYDEWLDLYPCISLLASIALIVPVSSVNCERDFSAMNRVST